MLFPEKPKNLPHLADYLQHAANRRRLPLPSPSLSTGIAEAAALGGVLGGMAYLATSGAHLAAGLIAGGGAFLIHLLNSMRYAKLADQHRPLEEDMRLEREAHTVVMRMHASMHRRRLHRDLSPDIAAVLESAAEYWSRARTALLSPYWNRSDMSPHMQQVRDQSLAACERAMQELLVLYSTSVPEEPGSWNLAEVVDEVVGKSVFAGPRHHRFSPFHEDAMNLVEQLRGMAEEAESVSRQLISDPNLGAHTRPGASLQATLAELRSIRAAEDELREDLRG